MTPFLANSLWFASCLPEALAFQRATYHVAATQSRVLLNILQRSREYSGIRSVVEFQQHVPLSDAAVPIDELVIRYVPTSGTTAAKKTIPYTRSLLAEFQRGIAPWVVDLFRHEPQLLSGKSYWAISPVAGGADGFEDDSAYLGGCARGLVQAVQAVPATVRHIRNMEQWRRETLRHLMACPDLTFISVWHPSFLTLLMEPVRDPSRLWPKLRVISCWADAAAEQPAADLARLFPQARIQPKGLMATEGFVSLPLSGRRGCALAVRSHFFEFLDDRGDSYLSHELVCGREYSVVLTTGGGLYRYRLHDRIRVVSFAHECPLLLFVGKEEHISDRFGEKLAEQQVRTIIESLLARDCIFAEFMLVACELNCYTLFIESKNATDEELTRLAEDFEEALARNFHYRYCRDLGQLQPLRVFRIARGGRSAWLKECHHRGQRLGEVKPLLLRRDDGWMNVFEGRLVTSPGSVTLRTR